MDTWRKKLEPIDNDEAFAFDDEQRNGVLVETRRLKNLHANLLKRIRETQKVNASNQLIQIMYIYIARKIITNIK